MPLQSQYLCFLQSKTWICKLNQTKQTTNVRFSSAHKNRTRFQGKAYILTNIVKGRRGIITSFICCKKPRHKFNIIRLRSNKVSLAEIISVHFTTSIVSFTLVTTEYNGVLVRTQMCRCENPTVPCVESSYRRRRRPDEIRN